MPELNREDEELNAETDSNTTGEGPKTREGLRLELAEARAKAAENLANWQRAQADFINFKRRLELDRDEALKYAQLSLFQELLPVLDDFLYRSYRAGRSRVRVVHGKGTGVLRQEVRRFLSRHALVAGFRPADSCDGGDGAVDVNLV